MHTLRNYSQATALVLAIVLAGGAAAAERVYKWVDKDGVVHYGQQPPTATQSEAIKVQKGYSTRADDEPAAPKPAEAEAVAKDAATCAAARKNSEMLSGTEEITRRDDKGEPHVLTPEERKAELDRARAAMELYCKPAAEAPAPAKN